MHIRHAVCTRREDWAFKRWLTRKLKVQVPYELAVASFGIVFGVALLLVKPHGFDAVWLVPVLEQSVSWLVSSFGCGWAAAAGSPTGPPASTGGGGGGVSSPSGALSVTCGV